MSGLIDYVLAHTERGECKCGKCLDAREGPNAPAVHTVDMVFFTVALVGEPNAATFAELTKQHPGEFCSVDPFDGKDHSYLELGAWIGDQGLAMQYMSLGVMLGSFRLLGPSIMGIESGDPKAMQIASMGFLSIIKPPEGALTPHDNQT